MANIDDDQLGTCIDSNLLQMYHILASLSNVNDETRLYVVLEICLNLMSTIFTLKSRINFRFLKN